MAGPNIIVQQTEDATCQAIFEYFVSLKDNVKCHRMVILTRTQHTINVILAIP